MPSDPTPQTQQSIKAEIAAIDSTLYDPAKLVENAERIADRIRMLYRSDLEHEMVCVLGRDCIKALLAAHRAAVADAAAGLEMANAIDDACITGDMSDIDFSKLDPAVQKVKAYLSRPNPGKALLSRLSDAESREQGLRAEIAKERHATNEQIRDKHRILNEYQAKVEALQARGDAAEGALSEAKEIIRDLRVVVAFVTGMRPGSETAFEKPCRRSDKWHPCATPEPGAEKAEAPEWWTCFYCGCRSNARMPDCCEKSRTGYVNKLRWWRLDSEAAPSPEPAQQEVKAWTATCDCCGKVFDATDHGHWRNADRGLCGECGRIPEVFATRYEADPRLAPSGVDPDTTRHAGERGECDPAVIWGAKDMRTAAFAFRCRFCGVGYGDSHAKGCHFYGFDYRPLLDVTPPAQATAAPPDTEREVVEPDDNGRGYSLKPCPACGAKLVPSPKPGLGRRCIGCGHVVEAFAVVEPEKKKVLR